MSTQSPFGTSTTNASTAASTAPRIPAGNGYVARADGVEIAVGATSGQKPQIGWRVGLYRRKGTDLEHVGSLTHYRVISDHEKTAEITVENLQAFGATNVHAELGQLIRGKIKTLTGFGTKDAEASLKYESWEGKLQPRLSIFAAKLTMKNALSNQDAQAAAMGIDAMLERMARASGASAASGGGGLPDLGDDGEDGDTSFPFGAGAPAH